MFSHVESILCSKLLTLLETDEGIVERCKQDAIQHANTATVDWSNRISRWANASGLTVMERLDVLDRNHAIKDERLARDLLRRTSDLLIVLAKANTVE